MRKVILVVFVTLVEVFGAPSSDHERIIGGSVAHEGEFPYQIILKQHQSFVCSGAILDATTILTSAQCAHGNLPIPMTVVAGSNKLSSGGTEHAVVAIKVHEDYDPVKLINSVAILKVDPPIEFSDNAQPIEVETSYVGEGESAVFSGWGMTHYPAGPLSNNLQYLNTKTLSFDDCKKRFQDILEVVDTEICTLGNNAGACHGDDGGPLVANGKLLGLGNWTWPCASGYPDVYTRLSAFAEWITKYRN